MEDAGQSGEPAQNNILIDALGSAPEVKKNLEVDNRTITTTNQAFGVCETMVNDWKKGILNSATITRKLNGERPYNQKRLKDAGKDWKTNISTGFLATECRKIQPRLHMPLKTAKYLTASTLPSGYPDGAEKSDFFRQTITETIRSWPKWNFYLRGLAREVGVFGFAFNTWFDKYEWRPTLMRMDKGFVPQGTEVMDTEPAFFMAKYDYSPAELLSLLKANVESGRDEWQKNNTVKAINGAIPPPVDATYPNVRTYEDLVRQATWGWRYTKGYKVIRAWHLFAKEVTGKVSHYVLLADGFYNPSVDDANGGDVSNANERLLYEYLDEFDSMTDAVNAMVFDYGDGTIHGSWGAGQILYDLASQVEKIRCDSIDNMRLSNKIKATVADAKNVNNVELVVNDQMVILSGAQFSGTTAGMPVEIEGYELLDSKLTQIAQQKIGAFVPPIPLQPSDVKAAQINAALSKEKELQEDVLENWLIQFAVMARSISRRLCNPDSPDEVAQKCRATLLTRLTAEEIDTLCNQFPVQSVIEFTEYRAQQRAMFAHSVLGNPLFQQNEVARVMASGVGDERFVTQIVVPNGDQSDTLAAQRDQVLENAALGTGQNVPVLPKDNDWIHMQTLKPLLGSALQFGHADLAQIGLQHYMGHYAQGVNKKKIPDDQINSEKSWIASAEKVIQGLQQKAQIAQMQQQIAGGAQQAMPQAPGPQGLPQTQ